MQVLVNGVIQGALYALMGLAFGLVYATTRTFHVALGAIYALAPYILLACLQAGLGWVLGLLFAIGVSGAVGLLCEESLHWPFTRKNAPLEIHLIGSLGMFLVIIQVIALVWGNDTQVLRAGIDQVFDLGGFRLTWAQLVGASGAGIIIAVFFFWLKHSDLGLQFRAMSDNPILLSLQGRDIRRLRRSVFLISATIAAAAAIAAAYDVGFDPHVGLQAVLIGVIATIVGGRGSFLGATIAGFALGIISSQVVWHLSARWEEAVTFLILVAILFFRPQGLLGRQVRLEENGQ